MFLSIILEIPTNFFFLVKNSFFFSYGLDAYSLKIYHHLSNYFYIIRSFSSDFRYASNMSSTLITKVVDALNLILY